MTTGLAIFLSVFTGITSTLLGMLLAGGLGLVIGMFVFLGTLGVCILIRINDLEESLMSVMRAKTSTDEPSADTADAAEDNKNGSAEQ